MTSYITLFPLLGLLLCLLVLVDDSAENRDAVRVRVRDDDAA